jgi:hypothetical protein
VSDITITLIHKPHRYHCQWARGIIGTTWEQLRAPTCKRCQDVAGIIRYGFSKLRFPHTTEFLHKFYPNLGMRLPLFARPKKLEAYLFAGAHESTSEECWKLGPTDYTSSLQRWVLCRLAIHGSPNSGVDPISLGGWKEHSKRNIIKILVVSCYMSDQVT